MGVLRQGYEAYCLYLALKRHFTSSYDFFKYNGKVNATPSAFERRRDKYLFVQLAKHHDIQGLMIANILENPEKTWVGDLLTAESNDKYLQWKARQQSLTRHFTDQLSRLDDDFDSNFVTEDGKIPKALQALRRKDISYETLLILDQLCGFFDIWTKNVQPVVWENVRMIADKYRQFLDYDEAKMRAIALKHFAKSENP